jgi:hypothetical protein
MASIPCPGCRTALEPSATVCHICLRPRDKKEIIRAYATLKMMEKQRRQRPFVLAGYALTAAAAGWLLYRYHQPIIAASVSARASANRFFDLTMAEADPAVKRAAALTPVPIPAAAGTPPPPANPSQATLAGAAAPTRTSPAKAGESRTDVADLPLPAYDPGTQWAFYGRVYDLVTLLPVPNAQLVFTAVQGENGGWSSIARADENARFFVVLRRLEEGSYEIRASRTGYAAAALYESDIPYARLPLADRRDIVRSAQDGDITLPPLRDVAGEASARRDVFLAPSR